MEISKIRRIIIDVETDASGDFEYEVDGWGGWYLYAIRVDHPSATSERLATTADLDLIDPDLNTMIFNPSSIYNVTTTIFPLINTHSINAGSNTSVASRRSIKLFGKIRCVVDQGGARKKVTLHIFLSELPL